MEEFGIYTAADANFFPGVVVAMNSLRLHGYFGKIAVIDTGLDDWMRDYLTERGLVIISMAFTKHVRYTDVLSDSTAGMHGWSFKAFGIVKARLFKRFTYIDADYIPLCNLQNELDEKLKAGHFLCTEDGWNDWTEKHEDAIGVKPGRYLNINAGFFGASIEHHEAILEEWRNLMTRIKPFDLWYGDQGALNAILDKYSVSKEIVGSKLDWNQTWENSNLAAEGLVVRESISPPILRHKSGQRIYGWHGCGWHRYWHAIGIDHHRKDKIEAETFRQECVGKVPAAICDTFQKLLIQNDDFAINEFLLSPRTKCGPMQEMYRARFSQLTDKGTKHSYIQLYEDLFSKYRDMSITLLEIGVWGGGSLLLWAEYFQSATIVGIDKDLSNVTADVRHSPRIRLVSGDALCPDTLAEAVTKVDIVVDDGSHRLEDQLAVFRALSDKLNAGGIYVIEDITSLENARQLQALIPNSEIIDRRFLKGTYDDIVLVHKRPFSG